MDFIFGCSGWVLFAERCMNSILAGSIHRSFSSPLAWGADRAGRDRGDWGLDSGSFPFSGRMAASCSCLEQKRWDVDMKRCTWYSKQASVISHRLQGGVVQGETTNSPLHILWEARETGCPCPCEMMRCDGTGMTEPQGVGLAVLMQACRTQARRGHGHANGSARAGTWRGYHGGAAHGSRRFRWQSCPKAHTASRLLERSQVSDKRRSLC